MMTEYFKQRVAAGAGLAPLPDEPITAPTCGECPADNMYLPYVEALKQEPIELQEAYLQQWFCHCDSSRRCRGANALVRASRG